MGSRSTLAWEKCEVCGRHGPVFHCARMRASLCVYCMTVLCRPGAPRRVEPRRRVRRQSSLTPDEDLIESLASRRRRRR